MLVLFLHLCNNNLKTVQIVKQSDIETMPKYFWQILYGLLIFIGFVPWQ